MPRLEGGTVDSSLPFGIFSYRHVPNAGLHGCTAFRWGLPGSRTWTGEPHLGQNFQEEIFLPWISSLQTPQYSAARRTGRKTLNVVMRVGLSATLAMLNLLSIGPGCNPAFFISTLSGPASPPAS